MARGSKETAEPRKAKITRENLRETYFLFSYLKPFRTKFFLALVCIALSAFSTSAFPFLLGKMIDAASPGASQSIPQMSSGFLPAGFKEMNWSLNTIIILLFFQLSMQMVFSFFRVYLLTEVGEKALAAMRKDVYTKLISMPVSFFTEKRVGELSSRISSDLSQIQDAVSFTLAEFLRGVFTLIIGLALIVWISAKLTLVMLSVVPIIAILAVVFGVRIRKMSRKVQDQLANSGTVVQETFQGISMVKAFTSEYIEIARYTKSIYSAVDIAISNARYRGAFISFMIFSVFGTIAFVMWYGASMIQKGELTTGLLTMFVIFSVFVGGTFAGFADMFSQLQKTLGATQSIREIMRENGEDLDLQKPVLHPEKRLTGAVSFRKVAFSYPSRPEIAVLKDVSMEVAPGEQIALVGMSGAGKSTIASLLLRFYEPSSGEIRFDDKTISHLPLQDLRAQIALVPQDVILFGGTIRENIAYGKPEATHTEIEEAASKANASGFISKFPEGFDTVVGERGVKLSGGQRQRIAIARAILKDPAILILDEATSSLDSESEQYVQDALEKLMKNRTSFVIAHRLSTIRKADKIMVLDKGILTESGTHESLMQNENGIYRKLVEMQYSFAE